jgi:hypothetical protein
VALHEELTGEWRAIRNADGQFNHFKSRNYQFLTLDFFRSIKIIKELKYVRKAVITTQNIRRNVYRNPSRIPEPWGEMERPANVQGRREQQWLDR